MPDQNARHPSAAGCRLRMFKETRVSQQPSPPPFPVTPAAVLPYATPMAYQPTVTAWREGPVLIVPTLVSLPDACVKCSAPAGGWRLRKTLAWHNPLLALMIIFPGLLIYAIVAL